MNLSNAIIKEVKNILPHRIVVNNISENIETNPKENEVPKQHISLASLKKMELIKTVKKLYKEGYSMQKISNSLSLSPKTVKRYILSNDILKTATYVSSNRKSQLDKYRNLIINLYKEKKSIQSVMNNLISKGINVKYSTLHDYISKKLEITFDQWKINKYVKRKDIINYILSWNYDEGIDIYLKNIFEKYPDLLMFKDFYDDFKSSLVTLDKDAFLTLLQKEYNLSFFNSFIKGLKNDFEAVVNASTYQYNNGIAEGSVNKLKLIKRQMYGRASIQLLKNMVLYQSYFTT